MSSPEREFLVDLATSAFLGTPCEPVWLWAERSVWLDERMVAQPQWYRSDLTPWTREWQELVRQDRPRVREAVFMKSSQSGVTEASLNIVRWMPVHWPGNVLYATTSREEAKKVARTRLLPTLARAAGPQITGDDDDLGMSRISLRNMEIVVGGSGSSGPFLQTWYRLIVLDELENHEQRQETSTYDRAKSRQATVADGLLLAMSKPEIEGGLIHHHFLRGTQKRWLVPCPRCGEEIELVWSGVQFGGAKDLIGGWELKALPGCTWYRCQRCGGRIDEGEKAAMVRAGRWEARPGDERMRGPGGKVVPAEPGVESYHISDLYSLWPSVSWAELAKLYLSAHVITPNEASQKYFRTNHLGLPWEPLAGGVTDAKVLALRGGLVEEAKDGVRTVVGTEYRTVYRGGECTGECPVQPDVVLVTGDKQGNEIKFVVWAWRRDGQAWHLEHGRCQGEQDLVDLRLQPYPVRGGEPVYPYGGLIDCGYRPHEVFRACLAAQAAGFELHPARGSGFNANFRGRQVAERFDEFEGAPLIIYDFYDHAWKSNLYLGKIGRRDAPRLWMPMDLDQEFVAELTAERLILDTANGRRIQRWEHDRHRDGPNDWGDACKMQLVAWHILAPVLAEPAGLAAGASAARG